MALIQITEPGQALDPHQRKRAAGIDLGTTNSLIAAVRSGQVDVLKDLSGVSMLPSVVHYSSTKVTVGTEALSLFGLRAVQYDCLGKAVVRARAGRSG